jgi:DNA repair protein SbcD/Mre11
VRGELADLLTHPRHAALEGCWLQVTLTDAVRPAQALDRLRQRFPHALVVAFDRPDALLPADRRAPVVTTARADIDVLADFFAATRSSAPMADELALLGLACDACRVDEDLAS